MMVNPRVIIEKSNWLFTLFGYKYVVHLRYSLLGFNKYHIEEHSRWREYFREFTFAKEYALVLRENVKTSNQSASLIGGCILDHEQ